MAALASSLSVLGAAQPHAIPSGQEELMLDMLGRAAELPHGCELSGITTQRDAIFATYSCGEHRPFLELRHAEAEFEGLRTKNFVVKSEGDSVPSLLPAIAPIIERHEAAFRWVAPRGSLGRATSSPAEASAELDWVNTASSGLLGLAVSLGLLGWAAWVERKGGARRPGGGKGTRSRDCPKDADGTSQPA